MSTTCESVATSIFGTGRPPPRPELLVDEADRNWGNSTTGNRGIRTSITAAPRNVHNYPLKFAGLYMLPHKHLHVAKDGDVRCRDLCPVVNEQSNDGIAGTNHISRLDLRAEERVAVSSVNLKRKNTWIIQCVLPAVLVDKAV